MFRKWIDKLWASIRKRIEGKLPDSKPDKPKDDLQWRDDVAEIRAKDGKITFWTRNLSTPTGGGHNTDGGMEWIITRVEGGGYNRLLIMVMGGNRPASRIYMQDGGGAPFWNSAWPMPLMDQAKWEVQAKDGRITITLNGKLIWERTGNYTVERAVMNHHHNRKSTGQWAV